MTTKITVSIPPSGRLGIRLVDGGDGRGAIVSVVNHDSPLSHTIVRGDRVVRINEVDVRQMNAVGKCSLLLQRHSLPQHSFCINLNLNLPWH